MQYAAIMLCPAGGVIRHEETQEVANVIVGDFDSLDQAIEQACVSLNCTHLSKGVLSKSNMKGGFMLVTTQELESV
ncbi:TPA: hypothetical protein ACF367_002948 [Vibrio parahaemolyticus]|uniref:hypothetical protein n=1 Tax=Vibrio parahaemolyticus TaxID=670 RepID=UPI00111E938B|nr:hypothetical protein [Vibrio parahaemolyticus]EGQ7674503.1 hypothetical protein [Vibrio parahaemolyticus]EGQ9217364.1 hypothetical protein [Vibrio parahaemolyticus]TOM43110.1 hypothetical protein CGH79_20315 [Vibrio parahaemolyticus]TOM95618.1 hypothetical protein CGH65_23135 [Vibrio parahaemolyticus]HBC3911902.1 hypothetical protein [Vibrio parahaemolyticus]